MFNWVVFGNENEMTDQIKEFWAQVPFYGNKVIKLNQEKDTAWVNAYYGVCETLRDYVINNATGLYCWNAKGNADGFD